MTKKEWGLIVLLQCVVSVLAALIIVHCSSSFPAAKHHTPSFVPRASLTPSPSPTSSISDDFVHAVQKASPSVVSIYTRRIEQTTSGWTFFQRQQRTIPGLGSGVIMDQQGHIVTNYHVIAHAKKILVALNDGRHIAAHVVGMDQATDLAVLKINLHHLPFMTVYPPLPKVGSIVLAIGNPFGVGQTITQGIVSGLGRQQLGITRYDNFIQTDAAINPGNSGGALINLQGQLIGINTAMFSGSGTFGGIGFAIPSATVQKIMAQLIQHGHVERGWVGVQVQDLSRRQGHHHKKITIIQSVLAGSPAHHAGLRPGDIIIAMNGRTIHSAHEFSLGVADSLPGSRTQLIILRGKKRQEVTVLVGQQPSKTH